MASYLEAYGIEEYRRNRVIKYIIFGLLGAIVLALAAYWFLQDHTEKQMAQRFLSDVNQHNYQAAYLLWCPTPCRNYDYNRFAADWADSKKAASPWKIDSTDSCKGFLTVNVTSDGKELQSLGIERGTNALSFAPSPECQEYKWRWKQFFRRLLGGSAKVSLLRGAPPWAQAPAKRS